MILATPGPKIPENGPESEFRAEFLRNSEPRWRCLSKIDDGSVGLKVCGALCSDFSGVDADHSKGKYHGIKKGDIRCYAEQKEEGVDAEIDPESMTKLSKRLIHPIPWLCGSCENVKSATEEVLLFYMCVKSIMTRLKPVSCGFSVKELRMRVNEEQQRL
jgi:hypothetical protein